MPSQTTATKMTNYRWAITSLLFFSVAINYMDRQVLSLTWKDFIAPEFHWTNNDYGTITGLFSIFYEPVLKVPCQAFSVYNLSRCNLPATA